MAEWALGIIQALPSNVLKCTEARGFPLGQKMTNVAIPTISSRSPIIGMRKGKGL